jgi:4-hydroxybenzoate polyprenyltransferase
VRRYIHSYNKDRIQLALMESIRKRSLMGIGQGMFLLCHPLPVLFHIIGVTVFTLLAAWPTLVWGTIILVIAAHTFMQLAIAILNDYSDRRLDALSKKRKPIPLGLIRPGEALALGILCIILMLALLLLLPPLALLISLLYLACGLGYNFGLKATPFSGIVFALAMPLIPIYAFVAMGHIIPFLFWLVPVAALVGIALNLANSLPDIEDDAAEGVRTLAVVLGVQGTSIASPLLILISMALITLLAVTHTVPVQPMILPLTLLACCVLITAQVLLIKQLSDPARRKQYFYLVVVTCLLLAGGWITGALV